MVSPAVVSASVLTEAFKFHQVHSAILRPFLVSVTTLLSPASPEPVFHFSRRPRR